MKEKCGESIKSYSYAGKAPAGKNYAVKVNAGKDPRTGYSYGMAIGYSYGMAIGYSYGMAIGYSYGMAIGYWLLAIVY